MCWLEIIFGWKWGVIWAGMKETFTHRLADSALTRSQCSWVKRTFITAELCHKTSGNRAALQRRRVLRIGRRTNIQATLFCYNLQQLLRTFVVLSLGCVRIFSAVNIRPEEENCWDVKIVLTRCRCLNSSADCAWTTLSCWKVQRWRTFLHTRVAPNQLFIAVTVVLHEINIWPYLE